MNAREKVAWLQVLVTLYGFLLLPVVMVTLIGPGPKVAQMIPVLGWAAIGISALYLLILSWRAAYVSGRSNLR